jgi:predicted HTH transcriptional regulator
MADFDAAEIAKVLEQGEGRQVEFKEGVAEDGRIARTICAFANTRGGILIVGVTDRGRPIGAPRPAAIVEALHDLAAQVEPPVPVRVQRLALGSLTLVCCSVPLSPARPHAVPAGPGEGAEVFVRVGASNRIASPAAIAAIGTPFSRRIAPTPIESRILREAAGAGREGLRLAEFQRDAVGKQRARQAFERLERAGRLVAHGFGARRRWSIP